MKELVKLLYWYNEETNEAADNLLAAGIIIAGDVESVFNIPARLFEALFMAGDDEESEEMYKDFLYFTGFNKFWYKWEKRIRRKEDDDGRTENV